MARLSLKADATDVAVGSETSLAELKSGIYRGSIRHRRFSPAEHDFSYPLFMLALDLDEIDTLKQAGRRRVGFSLGFECRAPLSVYRGDYLRGTQGPLKQAVKDKVTALGGCGDSVKRVVLLCQPRCFGVYFSPINMYFCYSQSDTPAYMLAEVSNTPWNERHCYLVNLENTLPTDKTFHVSPFMPLDMQYHWQVTPPEARLRVHIENRGKQNGAPVFDATLAMRRKSLTPAALRSALFAHPNMVLSLLKGIYWQALRLFLKRTPLHLHPKRS